jgi:hypothetical protein
MKWPQTLPVLVRCLPVHGDVTTMSYACYPYGGNGPGCRARPRRRLGHITGQVLVTLRATKRISGIIRVLRGVFWPSIVGHFRRVIQDLSIGTRILGATQLGRVHTNS